MFTTWLSAKHLHDCTILTNINYGEPWVSDLRFEVAQKVFADGQYILCNNREEVVGYCSSFILHDTALLTEKWSKLTDDGHLFKHDPKGKWLVIADMLFMPTLHDQHLEEEFYFRLRCTAAKHQLDGFIHTHLFKPCETSDAVERFNIIMERYYNNGFVAGNAVENFRTINGESHHALHFVWSWRDKV